MIGFIVNKLNDFNSDIESYVAVSKTIKEKVLAYLSKQSSYKIIYESLIKSGIKSFSSEILLYIYNVYLYTGCSLENPVYAVFDFICKLKICRKYLKIDSTYIKGTSGGYASQNKIYNTSIYDDILKLYNVSVLDENKNPYYTDDTSSVVFGNWYASTADTGRWQATVHNVPAGAFCKRRFTSRYKGGVILAADMSQMEVRELAMASNCKKLIDTIKDPTVDIHKRTASLAFNIPYDEVTKAQRKQAKEGIFSVIYGKTEENLAQSLFNGDGKGAKRLMDSIFSVYPEVKEYLEYIKTLVDKYGYVVTRRGMPIYVNPFLENGKEKNQAAMYRNADNFPIQGGASYICTNTLVNVQKLINKLGLQHKIKIVCYIHDSIEIDVSPDVLDIAYQIMYTAFNVLPEKLYNVPAKGDIVIGVSMGEELEFNRINENHYIVEGNNTDIIDLIDMLSYTYDVTVLNKEIGETENLENNMDWVFVQKGMIRWYDEIRNSKYEFLLKPKG